MSTDVAVTESQEKALAELQSREAEIAGAATAGIGERDVVLPVLKITQQQSKETASGAVPGGHFVNTLTKKDYGESVEIIVAHTFKGRFYSDDNDNVFVAGEVEHVPSNWPEELAGRRFDELPDAEETYRQRVDAKEIDWGKGPPIRTTHNYVGLTVDDLNVPVRVSLQRTSVPAARVINTLIRFTPTPWAQTIKLSSVQKFDRADHPYFVVEAAGGEQTTVEQRLAALSLADTVQNAEVRFAGDEPDADKAAKRAAAKEAEAKGGLDV